MWDKRFSSSEYIYGKEPNEFFQREIQKYNPGKILFVAEGEGRNAVYAAQLGWEVSAFDTSSVAKKKALLLAQEKNVELNYQVGNLPELDFKDNYYDCITFIYAHLPRTIRSEYHQLLKKKLKKNGIIIFEGFSTKHLEYQKKNPNVGGPSNLKLLFTKDELFNDFFGFEIIYFEEEVIELNEGEDHKGKGSVIRFVGSKL